MKYLKKNHYSIIKRNFYCRWGEIDIVAKKADIIYFFEVKTRIGDRYGLPFESITPRKIRDLKRAIDYYLLKNKLFRFKLSLKIMAVILDENHQLKQLKFYDGPEFR